MPLKKRFVAVENISRWHHWQIILYVDFKPPYVEKVKEVELSVMEIFKAVRWHNFKLSG